LNQEPNENDIPTEPRIPVFPPMPPGDVHQAILNIASIARSCFEEMRVYIAETGDLGLVKLIEDAETACTRLQSAIIHRS